MLIAQNCEVIQLLDNYKKHWKPAADAACSTIGYSDW